MYFSNNSRYVLRKARFLSPNYLNKIGKNLSVKKPKDDPTKPPLRINIPDDNKDEFLQKKKNPIEVRTTSTPFNRTFQDDVFHRSDVDFANVENILINNKMEEPSSSDRVSYTHKAINSEKLDSRSDMVSFDNINNNNNTFGSSKKVAKSEKKASDGPIREKTWYVLVDVNAKNKGQTGHDKTGFRVGKHKESSSLQKGSVHVKPKTPKQKKSDSLLQKSKHLSKFAFNKPNRKPSRFQVHEVEDEATYILYVKLNKQLNKKPCEVGYVPEREFTIRTGSNREHQEMSEGGFGSNKPPDSEKGKKKPKPKKNEQIVIVADKPLHEPVVPPPVNVENAGSVQDVNWSGEKAKKSNSGVVQVAAAPAGKSQYAGDGSISPGVSAADAQNVYADYSSPEQMPKVEPSDPQVASTTPQDTSTPQQSPSTTEAAVASSYETQAPAYEASTPQVASTPYQEASKPQAASTPYQEATAPYHTSEPVQEASTPYQEVSAPVQEPPTQYQEVSAPVQESPTPHRHVSTPEESTPPLKGPSAPSDKVSTPSEVVTTLSQMPSKPSAKESTSQTVSEILKKLSAKSQKASSPSQEALDLFRKTSSPSRKPSPPLEEASSSLEKASRPSGKPSSVSHEPSSPVQEASSLSKTPSSSPKEASSSSSKPPSSLQEASTLSKTPSTQEASSPPSKPSPPLEEASTPSRKASSPLRESSSPSRKSFKTPSKHSKVSSTSPETSIPIQEASTPSQTPSPSAQEASSPPPKPSYSLEEPSTPSQAASSPLHESSSPSQKSFKTPSKASSPPRETTIPVQEASTPGQTGSTLFRDEGIPPGAENICTECQAQTDEYLGSENAVPTQKYSMVQYEKAQHNYPPDADEYKTQVEKGGSKGKTKIPVSQINKKVPIMKQQQQQQQEAMSPSTETVTEHDLDDKKYLNIHDKSDDKPDKTGGGKKPSNIWRASQQDKNDVSNDVSDFQTSCSFVTIGRTETYPMTFGAAFPPLLKEALNAHLKLKNNFNEKWKNLSKDDLRSDNRMKYSENSILFPKSDTEEFDCESLFTTKEQIILNIIKNDEEIRAKSTEIAKEVKPSVDSLTVMKKVKEMVQLDLDNVVKIFDGGQGEKTKELSSVVVSTTDGWEVQQGELDTQMALRKSEMKLESMDFTRNILGDENTIRPPKFLPPLKGSGSDMHLPNEQINSVIIFNPKTEEFFISKELLAEALSRKAEEPMDEISHTLNIIAKSSINSKDLKSGDSILVFDDETQSWKVDFSILEKRKQQLDLEEELTKRSELILETFEQLEKNQMSSVPRPDSKGKKTFDYVNKEWKDMKSPDKKSTKPKFPFKDSTSEEIRKKNSDLYENLFVAKKKDPNLNNPEKKAPGVSSSSSKKESKSADGGGSKEASTGGSAKSGPTSKEPEVPKSDSKIPPAPKPEKIDDDNFWEYFLKMNILPKDISEIPKPQPKPVPEPKKIEPKIEKPSLKIPNPFRTSISKKESEKEIKKDISVKITPPSDKTDKSSVKAPPLTNQITKQEPKKTDLPNQSPKVELPKSEKSKQPPKLDLPTQSPKVDPPKSDSSKAPPKLELPKSSPKVEPPKSEISKQPPKVDPPKSDTSKPPKLDPPKSDASKQPTKVDSSKTDSSKPPPKEDPPKTDPPKDPPKLDPPKNPPKVDPPKPPSKADPPKQPPKADPPKTSKAQDPKTTSGAKSASAPADHYVSDKIIEMSRIKGREPSKITKIETVKLNITPDTRLPSKITEINLNRKGKLSKEAQTPTIGDKNTTNDTEKTPQKEKKPLCNKLDKYKTPFSDPEYEDKPMKIKSDIVSNPNLKKLDNWNKTLVLHDIMKPPENIETWLKDETDKMATLLLKILQEASDGKPKRKQLPLKPKPGENSSKGNPKKQENTPESFLLRVRTVNFSLENENKKPAEDNSKPVEVAKTAKPANAPDTKLPLEKNVAPAATPAPSVKTYHLPASLDEWKCRNFPWGADSVGDFAPAPNEPPPSTKLIADITDDIPGPEILKKISNTWRILPVVDSQVTIFTLFRVFQLVNMGKSFFSPINSAKMRRNSFSNLFSKYGPIVNVKGPFSGNVILIHRPEHLSAVFDQDASIFVRSVFDSIEHVRKESDQKSPSEFSSDWMSLEWGDLKRATNDSSIRGCERYLAPAEIAVNSLIGIMRKNRNSQDLVSEDFMNEIKRWSLEGLCSVLFEKSFGFMEGRIPNTYWVLEPDKLYDALEKATECLNKCERGFQMWRVIPTPSTLGLSQAYRSMSSILMKQILQSAMNLKNKNQLLRDGNLFRIRDLTFLESMLLNDGLSNDEINCNLIDMLLIGTNVLNSTIGFLLYNLSLNIRAQTKLFQELKEVLPSKHSNLDYNKLVSLKYLQACIKENFRLHMPIPVFNRLLQNDILLSNYFIPKGTYVVMDQRVANPREHMFEDPDSFSPERWLTGEKWMQEFESFASFPLCHGPRAEFAKKVMELQLFTFVAKILRNFHIEYHYGEIQGTNNLINFPDKPLKLNFIERET